MLVAFALRAAWVSTVSTPLGGLIDYQWYYASAENLANGAGLTVFYHPDLGYLGLPGGQPAIFWPPGYPLLLGAAFKAFGTSVSTGEWLNVAASTAAVPLTYALGRRVAGAAAGIVAAMFAAVYPASIFWCAVLVSEMVFTPLFAGAIVLAMGQRPSAARGTAIGALSGVAAAIRPQALVILPALWLWAWWWRREARAGAGAQAAAATVLCAAIVGGVATWNSLRADYFVPVSTNGAYNLRIGHAPYATGGWVLSPEEDLPEFASGKYDGGRLLRDAVRYAATHPLRELELAARKAVKLSVGDHEALTWVTAGRSPVWGSTTATERLGDLADAASVMALALATVGLGLRGVRRDEWRFLVAVVVMWAAVHIVFFGEPRFHHPVLPIVFVFGARAVVLGWAYARERAGGGGAR